MDNLDFIVIGAGVVGLAITAALTDRFSDSTVVLMEKHEHFGKETSSRNSEVIHSGIYYPTGSLKAKLCVRGKQLLYDFCEKWEVPFQRIGKIIIAPEEESISTLESLLKKGNENDVSDLQMLNKSQMYEMEPAVKAAAGLFSPSTGIVNSHILMAKLEAQSKKGGAMIAYGHEVTAIDRVAGGYRVAFRTLDGEEDYLECRCIINCASLGADKIAAMLGIDIDTAKYRIYPCKGEYFSIRNAKSKQISHLIYPPPMENLKGLGIHVTKSLDGDIRLGPNAFYVEAPDYDVDHNHKDIFYHAAKEYLPFLEYDDIEPDMAGIRPKIQGPSDPVRDFVIRHEEDKGLPGVISLLGIESPGLTSCLAIAEYVSDIIWDNCSRDCSRGRFS
jgi:L-2-hydroxyglutarate oxidase LhgO